MSDDFMLAPWRLDEHMHELAARFNLSGRLLSPGRELSPASTIALTATGTCSSCGRILIDATITEMRRARGHCAGCHEWPTEGRVDHAEWVAARRGGRL